MFALLMVVSSWYHYRFRNACNAEGQFRGQAQLLRYRTAVLVKIGGVPEMFLIDMDSLSIEQDSIPDGELSGVLKRESGEIELTLANTMHQLDARNRGRGTPKPFESEHHLRSGLDVSMVLFDQVIQILRGPHLRSLRQQALNHQGTEH